MDNLFLISGLIRIYIFIDFHKVSDIIGVMFFNNESGIYTTDIVFIMKKEVFYHENDFSAEEETES